MTMSGAVLGFRVGWGSEVVDQDLLLELWKTRTQYGAFCLHFER